MARYAIMAIGTFDYIYSKTGNMLIRYFPDDVVAVIDPEKEGLNAEQVLGWGGKIPCVKSFSNCIQFSPTHLVVGSAPQGGHLDKKSRTEIEQAIENGCNIISGLHIFLNEDPELVKKAKAYKVSLIDLRCPPHPPHFPKGNWVNRKFPVLLIVGSDCDTGKMTTAWEITKELKSRNRKVEFLGTGQTGILLSGAGVPIDAVISDFISGEIEYCIDQYPDETELVVIEGQGAINNILYSGVTMGLLHGSMPDFLVFTHEPGRDVDVSGHPFPEIEYLMKLHIDLLKPFKKSKFIGVNFLTLKLDKHTALDHCRNTSDRFGIPVTDMIRFKNSKFIDKIENVMEKWK